MVAVAICFPHMNAQRAAARRTAVLVLAFAITAGCARPLKNQPVCPESRSVRCMTPLVCAYDAKRGCEICRCDAPPYTPPDR